MPRKEPVSESERHVEPPGCVEQRHFHDALDLAVGEVCRRADIHAQAAGHRRSNLSGVQLFALDLAALEYIGGRGFERRFLPELKAECFHIPPSGALDC